MNLLVELFKLTAPVDNYTAQSLSIINRYNFKMARIILTIAILFSKTLKTCTPTKHFFNQIFFSVSSLLGLENLQKNVISRSEKRVKHIVLVYNVHPSCKIKNLCNI
jgi:hypothetical protein